MSTHGSVIGPMPGFCPRGQFGYGQIPGLRDGANSFAPVLAALAELSLHQGNIVSGNLGFDAPEQNTAEAVMALVEQGTLLSQIALCQILPTDGWKVIDPIAVALKDEVLPQIEQIDGFTFPKALAVAFIGIVLETEQAMKQTKVWGEFNPQPHRGAQTDQFNRYAEIVANEAYFFQQRFNPYGKGIEATTGFMLGALANMLKMKANYPTLEIPGLGKAVNVIEQFLGEAKKIKPGVHPLVKQATEFIEGQPEHELVAAAQIANTVVAQTSQQYGTFDLKGVPVLKHIDQVVGATPHMCLPQIFALITNTFEVSDPLPVRPGMVTDTTQEPRTPGREAGATSRQPAMAGAGSENGQH